MRLLLLAALSLATCYSGETEQTPSNRAEALPAPPRLDGRIGEGEWVGASHYGLVGGGEALLMWGDDDNLYLALRGDEPGWGHVYLTRADTVLVFHASAALGTAAYREGSTGWSRVAAFDWAVRDTSFSAEGEAERAAFFAEHGWVANTNGMGDGRVLEFRLAGDLVRGPETRWAVAFATDPSRPQYWPDGLADGTLDAALVRGDPPSELDFQPAGWAVVPPTEPR